jgi:hypothetical protein
MDGQMISEAGTQKKAALHGADAAFEEKRISGIEPGDQPWQWQEFWQQPSPDL